MTKMKAMILAHCFMLPTVIGYAGCNPCGCNPAGTASAHTEPEYHNWPTQPITVGLCCDPDKRYMTATEVVVAKNINVTGSDVDKYVRRWFDQLETCACILRSEDLYPGDTVVVEWSGTIDRCQQGAQTIKCKLRNTTVSSTAVGGAYCTAYDSQGQCTNAATCESTCSTTVIEERERDLTVTVVPHPCYSGCLPDAVTWTCNSYYPEPDGFGPNTFTNHHFFDFTLQGIPYGSGNNSTERVQINHFYTISEVGPTGNTQVDGDGTWWRDDQLGWVKNPSTAPFHEVTSLILCTDQDGCAGTLRVLQGDTYGFYPTGVPDSYYAPYQQVLGGALLMEKWVCNWMDHKLYLNRNMPTTPGIDMGGWTSTVNLMHDIFVTGSGGNWINRSNYRGVKSGPI